MYTEYVNLEATQVQRQTRKFDRDGTAKRLEFLAGKVRRGKIDNFEMGMISLQDRKLVVERLYFGDLDNPKRNDRGFMVQNVVSGLPDSQLVVAYNHFTRGMFGHIEDQETGVLTIAPGVHHESFVEECMYMGIPLNHSLTINKKIPPTDKDAYNALHEDN